MMVALPLPRSSSHLNGSGLKIDGERAAAIDLATVEIWPLTHQTARPIAFPVVFSSFKAMNNEALNASTHGVPQRQALSCLAAGDRAAIYSFV